MINEQWLAKKIAKKYNLSFEMSKEIINYVEELIIQSVARGERILLCNFGVFRPFFRKARKCPNPRTKEMMEVPAMKIPKFTASKYFKKRVKNEEEPNNNSQQTE